MKCLCKGVGMGVLFGVLALTASVTGCSSAGDQGTESQTGKVSMRLTGQTNGDSYRLRNARFDVTGGSTPVVLDSETDLTAATLNATLATGSYSINLEPGWSLERSDAGVFEVVDATLTSPNPKDFQILGGGTTNVAYQFSTNGTIVTIGTGELSVSISVVENGGMGAACSFATQTGCPAPEACYLVLGADGMSGSGQCFPAGSIAIGAPCTGAATNECVADGVCADDGTGTGAGACDRMCDPTTPGSCPGGQTCLPTSIPTLGICG